MKKVWIVFALLFILSLSSCKSPLSALSDREGDEPGGDSSAFEDVGADSAGGKTEKSGNEWPSGLKDIPAYTYGRIVKVLKNTDTYDGISFVSYQIDYEDMESGGCEKYSIDLENAGFTRSQEPVEQESPISGTTFTEYGFEKYAFETDDTIYHIDVDFWSDSNHNGQVYISVPETPEEGVMQEPGDMFDDDGENDDGDSGGSEFNWDTLSDTDVPDGYPHDDVPLIGLDSGELLGASRQEMGGMGTSYVIVFGIDENVDAVCALIETQMKDHVTEKGGTFNSLLGSIFMGEIHDCEFNIAVGDGTADGYETVVSYTVICT